MDELLQKIVSTEINAEEKDDKTGFKDLYKNNSRLNNQEERRKTLLENQKSNRNAARDSFRGILEIVQAVESHNVFGTSQKAFYRPNIYVAGFVQAPLSYNNILMQSEWMIEKPLDFEENWFVVPCPKGVRVLLVASHGRTKLYNKHGRFRIETQTLLPGGDPSSRKNKCCVLDGFYVSSEETFYVLDVLAWNNQAMTDGETEFRHFWLQTHVFEIKGLDSLSKNNKLKLKLLPKISCQTEEFNKFMMKYPPFENFTPMLDGLLFYHKQTHYISSQTPLVLWLYPYMVKEIIGSDVTVHEGYSLDRPENYTNQADFIQEFEAKYAKKKHGRESNKMQTEDIETKESTKNSSSTAPDGPNKDDMEVANEENEEETMEASEDNQKRGTKRRQNLPDSIDIPTEICVNGD